MPRLKSLSLRVHVGRRQLAWSLVHRTDDGHSVFDRRLHSGSLSLPDSDLGPLLDVPSVVREILRRLEDDMPTADSAQRPGALEGGGGRPTIPLQAVCPSACPSCGHHLDGRSLSR